MIRAAKIPQGLGRAESSRERRSRNVRTGLILVATFATLFLGSVLYIIRQSVH